MQSRVNYKKLLPEYLQNLTPEQQDFIKRDLDKFWVYLDKNIDDESPLKDKVSYELILDPILINTSTDTIFTYDRSTVESIEPNKGQYLDPQSRKSFNPKMDLQKNIDFKKIVEIEISKYAKNYILIEVEKLLGNGYKPIRPLKFQQILNNFETVIASLQDDEYKLRFSADQLMIIGKKYPVSIDMIIEDDFLRSKLSSEQIIQFANCSGKDPDYDHYQMNFEIAFNILEKYQQYKLSLNDIRSIYFSSFYNAEFHEREFTKKIGILFLEQDSNEQQLLTQAEIHLMLLNDYFVNLLITESSKYEKTIKRMTQAALVRFFNSYVKHGNINESNQIYDLFQDPILKAAFCELDISSILNFSAKPSQNKLSYFILDDEIILNKLNEAHHIFKFIEIFETNDIQESEYIIKLRHLFSSIKIDDISNDLFLRYLKLGFLYEIDNYISIINQKLVSDKFIENFQISEITTISKQDPSFNHSICETISLAPINAFNANRLLALLKTLAFTNEQKIKIDEKLNSLITNELLGKNLLDAEKIANKSYHHAICTIQYFICELQLIARKNENKRTASDKLNRTIFYDICAKQEQLPQYIQKNYPELINIFNDKQKINLKLSLPVLNLPVLNEDSIESKPSHHKLFKAKKSIINSTSTPEEKSGYRWFKWQ